MGDLLGLAANTAVAGVLILALLTAGGLVAMVAAYAGRPGTRPAGHHRRGRCACWTCHVRTAGVIQPPSVPPDPPARVRRIRSNLSRSKESR